MKLIDWLAVRLPFFTGRDVQRAHERGLEAGYDLGRDVGYVQGYSARLRQEHEARRRAQDAILRVIQGGKR